MLSNLKENELQLATTLINDGLDMAKVSMEQILQSPIVLKKIDYGHDEEDIPQVNSKNGDRLHLIKTELKGQLKGSCFLIFSEEEVEKIYNTCLSPDMLADNSDQGMEMKMAFLTEIDNMVSAAVITKFSNFLDLELFGYVPSVNVISADEVKNYLDAELATFETIIHFKAIFHGTELDISPDFIWMFNDKFLEKIKDFL